MKKPFALFPCHQCGAEREQAGVACRDCGWQPPSIKPLYHTGNPAPSPESEKSNQLWLFVLCVLPIMTGVFLEGWAIFAERSTAGRAKPFPALLFLGVIGATILNAFAGLVAMVSARNSSDPAFRNLAWILAATALLLTIIPWAFVLVFFASVLG